MNTSLNKTLPIALVLAVTFALGSGCAKRDWIEQTLVTVDLTGRWVGSMGGVWNTEVSLELEQQGPKVTGYIRPRFIYPPMGSFPGPVEGTVGGDVFTFSQTNGTLVGEMTVSGDEMKGYVTLTSRSPISLRRVDSSARPGSQP